MAARGSREPLVLLPAMLADDALWAAQVKALRRRGDVIVHPLAVGDSIGEQARAVLDLTDGSFALAGLSLGAMVAMEVVRLAPERVTRLGLLDTNPRAPTEQQRETWRELADDVETDGVVEIVRSRLLPVLLHPDRRDALTGTVLEMAERVGAEGFKRQLLVQASRVDMRTHLRAVRCPTLVAAGAEDALCPPTMHEEICAEIPHAAYVEIEDCGHLAALERPRVVTALLDYWMQHPLPEGETRSEGELK
jgi:pimeloyl-ACP methyl ester carboxylesterase